MTWVVLQDVSMEDLLELSKHPQPWRKRVRDWWRKATTVNPTPPTPNGGGGGVAPPKKGGGVIPLFLLTPIHVPVENLGALYDKETKVVLPQGFEPKTPFVLFYSVPLETGWGGPIHILGIALTDKLLESACARTAMTENDDSGARGKDCRIGDLLQTHEYALEPVDRLKWLGSTLSDFWFKFCFSLSPATLLTPDDDDDDDKTAVAVTIEHIKYRAKLADVFWSNRQDKNFLAPPPSSRAGGLVVAVPGIKGGGDGYEMLRQLHESDSPYFDLGTPEGRTCDLISYWMFSLSAAIAPKESQQKKKRAHFERELLRFRIERYFFLERHFRLLLHRNGLLSAAADDAPITEPETKDVILIEDPGERERQLYCMRLPGGTITNPAPVEEDEYPETWMSVPEKHAGKEIVGSAMYDVDEGRVILTHRDMFQWAWTRMDAEFRTVTNRMLDERRERQARVSSDEHAQHVEMLLRQMHSEASKEDARDNAALESLRLARLGDMGVSGGLSLARVKQTFPPCMGRIVKDAFVHKTHPKHKSRVALVKFLLEAGYSVEDVEKLVYDMYEADRDYVYNQHDGRWDQEAYNSVFKDQVKHLHASVIVEKRISPYGCGHLTGYQDKEQKGTQIQAPPAAYGCPFASVIPGQKADTTSARSYLQWSGVKTGDIEDILKHQHPQLCCSSYYLERFPDNNGITISHPNQFIRGATLVETKKKRQKINL